MEDSNVLPNESEKSIISKRKYSKTVKRKKKGCANVLTQPHHFYEHFIVNQDLILHYLFLDTPNHPGTGK